MAFLTGEKIRQSKALARAKWLASNLAFPYAVIAASVQLHEATHAITARALGIPVHGIKVDPALGGKLMEYVSPMLSSGSEALTEAQSRSAESHFNQALVSAAPNIFGFASGAALMAYGLRKKNSSVFKVGFIQTAATAQYAAGELLTPLGDFASTGYNLMAAAHKHLNLINPAAFHDNRWGALVGAAAIAGTALAAYKLPSLAARSIARIRQKMLERKLRRST